MLNIKTFKKTALVVAISAATTLGSATSSYAQQDGAEDKSLEEVVVVGSRIKRSSFEGASPVEVVSTLELETQGRVSVADALRNITSNSFGSFAPTSGNSAQSQSTVSLLGAGSGRTLVLIDGKRIAGSPSLGGSSANLSSIPMAAVERIEILKDGASAVYGSDAIAGVVNVVLKKDFEGVAFDVQVGQPEQEGGDTKQVSLTFGASSDKGNITVVFDHQERGAIFDRDRPYTAPSMEDKNGDGLISIYDETVGISYYGATVRGPDGNLIASPKCDGLKSTVDGFVGVLDQGPYFGSGVGAGTVCGFAYSGVSANSASTDRDSVMANVTYNINDDLELYANAMLSRNDSFGRYAPPAAPWNNMSADNPHNPTGQTAKGYFRWYQLGNRDGLVTDYQQDYTIGLKGTVSDNIEWEAAYHKANLDYRSVGRYYLSYAGLAYNLRNNVSLGSKEGIDNMRATIYTENQNSFDHYFGGVGFALGELAGGDIQHYFGAEHFQQDFASKYDAQSEAGLIGGSAGNSAAGDRDTTALFYEVSLPVLDNLNVSAAYRYDDYSDFGGKGTPSIKADYSPTDDITLRASYSKGFRAPSLDELLAATSFSATSATDYVACRNQGIPFDKCRSRQIDNLIQSNKNLKPEESTYANIGVVYSGLENFTAKLDYFSLEVDNVISSITVQSLINAELGGILPQMMARYPGVSLTRDASGGVEGYVVTRSENGAFLSRKGFDLALEYDFETGFGDFNIKNVTTLLTEASSDVYFGGPVQNKIGAPGTPKWRSQLMVNYTVSDFVVNWTTDVIASTFEDSVLDLGDGNPQNFSYKYSNNNPSFVTHNINIKYLTSDYGTFTFGVRNLLDEGVILDDDNNWVDDNLYLMGHYGRQIYAGYNFSF